MVRRVSRVVLLLSVVGLLVTLETIRRRLRLRVIHDGRWKGRPRGASNELPDSPTRTIPDKGPYKSGDLIFAEEFHYLDFNLWQPMITMSGCGSGEFQIYDQQPENVFVHNGVLHIRPTPTADKYGEKLVLRGNHVLNGCNDPRFNGCNKTAGKGKIINPVLSARLKTHEKFAFMYGRVETRVKIPSADWTWPAIWLMPERAKYGQWPKSGEIDILEARGNRLYFDPRSWVHIGNQQVQSSLHFGVNRQTDKWRLCHMNENSYVPFSEDFHTLHFNWFPDRFEFGVDHRILTVCKPPEEGGLHGLGKFVGTNLWETAANPTVAPFDDYFYFIVNVAVGGMRGFFGDHYVNVPYKKPWSDTQTHDAAMIQFWERRNKWLPSWQDNRSALQIDYIRVWAV